MGGFLLQLRANFLQSGTINRNIQAVKINIIGTTFENYGFVLFKERPFAQKYSNKLFMHTIF